MKRGIATFTLDHGHCPPWLFERMVKLGREMVRVMVEEYGSTEVVARLGNPVWFQALGTVLAFDWNASGLTTVLMGALKEAIRGQELELGVFICGGKGKTSRKTPEQIQEWGERLGLPDAQVGNLEYSSRMSAKVDSALVQDGFELYHHCFIFARDGAWTVVQQGMNKRLRSARRYHWHSENLSDLINEPHSGISSSATLTRALNLTAASSDPNRKLSVELISDYGSLAHDLVLLDAYSTKMSQMIKIRHGEEEVTMARLRRGEFSHHQVESENFSGSSYLDKILAQLAGSKPANYESLLAQPGVGAKTVRALSLVSEVIYGAKASYRDPARYSFAHGGKDGTPYEVDRITYDQTISTLRQVIGRTRLDPMEKDKALQRLATKSQLG